MACPPSNYLLGTSFGSISTCILLWCILTSTPLILFFITLFPKIPGLILINFLNPHINFMYGLWLSSINKVSIFL